MAKRDDEFETGPDFELHADNSRGGDPESWDDEPEQDGALAVEVVAAGGGWDDELVQTSEESDEPAGFGRQDSPDALGKDDVGDDRDAELEAIVRRERDVELMAAAREHGVDSWQCEELELELTKYAYAVLTAWMKTGQIFHMAQKNKVKGIPEPSTRELDWLRRDEDLRDAIAEELIQKGIDRFERQIETNTGWTPEGGAALATYFLRNCLFSFKDVFNKRTKNHRSEQPLLDSHLSTRGSPPHDPERPDVHYSNTEAYVRVNDLINTLAEKEQRVLRSLMEGLTPQEIVELNEDIPSLGALRAIRQRIRNRNAWIELIAGEEEI
ncbi:hypothetical protein ACWDSF_33160 [Nocardia beijingensis]